MERLAALAAEAEGAELVEDAREDRGGGGGRLAGEDDHEFLATPAAAQVFEAEARVEQAPQRDEDLVADEVSVRVVDALEAVDVEDGERQDERVPAGLGETAGERVEESPAREQACERVALGHLAHEPPAVEAHAHAREHLLGHQGLGEVVVGTGLEGGDAALQVGATGDE